MPSIDMPLAKLLEYRPELTREPDFAAFWEQTLAATRQHPLNALVEPVPYPANGVLVHRLSYAGYGGQRVNGWYLLPEGASGPVPALICYHGYSGGAGWVHQYLPWVMLGCGVVAVDTRGQGGETGDLGGYGNGTITGWMTQGLLEPTDYYYRRAYTDCVRAVDFVCQRPELDTSKLAVKGGSQGGGLTIAVAGLDSRVMLSLPDVPFLCHYPRAIDISANGPYIELQRYFARYPEHIATALRTLSYFDGHNLAAGMNPAGRSLWSVGLWDDVCPPSTVYAAYHACPLPENDFGKQIAVYPYNKHEGGGAAQVERQIAWLAEQLQASW
ncbi:MAG: acetylxylan esterase [Fimbriimonadaceae bacterium]|nr:acetylxylan esterase [Fimbriimonadaceae bacterium]